MQPSRAHKLCTGVRSQRNSPKHNYWDSTALAADGNIFLSATATFNHRVHPMNRKERRRAERCRPPLRTPYFVPPEQAHAPPPKGCPASPVWRTPTRHRRE